MSPLRYIGAIVGIAVLGSSGCGDPLEPRLLPLPDETEEATLVDFLAGSVTEASAFDLISVAPVRTDQFSGWDFVFALRVDGTGMLVPRGAITEEDSDAGLWRSDASFVQLTEAPQDGYSRFMAVNVSEGDVFAVMSRRDPAFGTIRCRHFAKVEILTVDAAAGTLTFRHLVNPNCEQRTLVPGSEGP